MQAGHIDHTASAQTISTPILAVSGLMTCCCRGCMPASLHQRFASLMYDFIATRCKHALSVCGCPTLTLSCVFQETGREDITGAALSDGSSFICEGCGGVVSRRREAQHQFWCSKDRCAVSLYFCALKMTLERPDEEHQHVLVQLPCQKGIG